MKLLYGTGNPAKLSDAREWLSGLSLEILGLNDMTAEIPEVAEDGNTPLENARQKAMAYYKAFHIPVFSCDSGLYFDHVPEEDQPSVHVRTVKGRYLTDSEMLEHYAGLSRKYGGLTARYHNAICLVLDEDHILERMDDSLVSEPFLLASKPHAHALNRGYPLDSLSVHIETGKYYYDLGKDELQQLAVRAGFRKFFEELELLDVVNENGEPTGETIERTLAHSLGIRHRSSHVWLVRKKEGRVEILLQKRSGNKDSFPGCYDISSAGHIPAGEDYLSSALRELKEELGEELAPEELHWCGTRHIQYSQPFYGKLFRDNQVSRVYLLWRDRVPWEFKLQREEIEEVRWFAFEECVKLVKENEIPHCIMEEELDMVRSAIEGRFSNELENRSH